MILAKDQWQKKKQTKEQKREAKRAKLNPGAYKTALDVHNENELKRKRESEGEEGEAGEVEGKELPREGLKGKGVKKQKVDSDASGDAPTKTAKKASEEEIRQVKADKRREQRERKKARQNQKAEKSKAKKEAKRVDNTKASSAPSLKLGNGEHVADLQEDASESDDDEDEGDGDDAIVEMPDLGGTSGDIEKLDVDGLLEDDSSAPSSPSHPSPLSEESNQPSSTSSASSIVPLKENKDEAEDTRPHTATEEPVSKQDTASTEVGVDAPATSLKLPRLPKIDPELLQSRLAARIEALRAARKADGPNGRPARNRQELIEARRHKQEQRKTLKKELRAKAKAEANAENEAARLRGGSGSPLWSPAILSPREQENSFSFGRVAFEDGAQMDASLTNVLDVKKKKGPQDVKTALEAAQRKKSRLSGLDQEKRADIEEKDRWLNMKKRVYGEKIKDDTNLLKKTLKRKEKEKSKSEKEWTERVDGVAKSKEMRQKKREDNLRARREGKGVKKAGKPAARPGAKKPQKRAGFEGSFKSAARSTKP